MYGGYNCEYANADVLTGSYYAVEIPLRAGTYNFRMNSRKHSEAGKFDFYIGTTKVTSTPIDMYQASSAYNQTFSVDGIVVPTGGWYTIKILNVGKNASSGGYRLQGGLCRIDRKPVP